MRTRRTLLALVTIGVSLLFPDLAWSCKCHQTPPLELFNSVDAVAQGRVTDTDRRYLALAWCYIRALFGADLDDFQARCGIRATLQVQRYWKGIEKSRIRIATGRGPTDCGMTFEEGQEYVLYLHRLRADLYETSACMRPRRLEDAAEELAILGPGKTLDSMLSPNGGARVQRQLDVSFDDN